jgi:outer membrane lipoprotein carrier protein
LLFACTLQSFAQPELTATAVANQVDRHYNALRSLRIRFTEEYTGMGMQRRESGTMLLKKSGIEKLSKMRWSYDSPPGKVFVLDGKYAWFYAPGDAQVQRLPASQLDDLRSPLRFLLGHTQIAKELDHLAVVPDRQGYRLSGVPRGMEKRLTAISLEVNRQGEIASMMLEEAAGARTTFTFSAEQPNAPVNDADFIFRPPQGIPVVQGLPPV